MLANVEDDYDKDEPEPHPHTPESILKGKSENTTVTPASTLVSIDMASPTPAPADLKKPDIRTCYLDPLLPHFISAEPDKYDGEARLRFDRNSMLMDPEIPYFPMRAKEAYNDIRTTSDYAPPEQKEDIEMPSKKTLLASGEGKATDTHSGEDKDQATLEQEERGAMDKEANAGEDEDQPRHSARETKEPDRFAGNMKTIWKPGTLARNLGRAVLLGLCLLPTVIMAEPMNHLDQEQDLSLIHI